LSKLKSRQIERIRGVVGRNVGFLSGPHQGTRAKAATKTGAGALRPKTDGSKTDAKSQGKNGCKQATSGRIHAQTDASKTDEKRQGKNGRKQQAGKLRSKRTQAATGRTQAQTDAKQDRRKMARKKRAQAASERVHPGKNVRTQHAGALKPKRTQKKQGKTIRKQATRGSTQSQADASSKRVQNGRKQQLRGAHRTRTHTSQGAGEEPSPHVIGVKVICINKPKSEN
jgi:rubrerythrin